MCICIYHILPVYIYIIYIYISAPRRDIRKKLANVILFLLYHLNVMRSSKSGTYFIYLIFRIFFPCSQHTLRFFFGFDYATQFSCFSSPFTADKQRLLSDVYIFLFRTHFYNCSNSFLYTLSINRPIINQCRKHKTKYLQI